MRLNEADCIYIDVINEISETGTILTTRNSEVQSSIGIDPIVFTSTPLVTVRKTAWKKAIREMEWFLSGNLTCPEELLDWWGGQLSNNNYLIDGYSIQFRQSTYEDEHGEQASFDQVKFILDGLRNSPNSRRLLISLWNPGEMANITISNRNPNTPTVCHSVLMQFFVRDGKLYINSYQRSADVLLGVPHNWIQSWALLLYFAFHSNLQIGGLKWIFGDAHIYQEESHLETVKQILVASPGESLPVLCYNYSGSVDSSNVPVFRASDFSIDGEIPQPKVTIRPKLL